MPRARKKLPDLGAMADEVNDILHELSAAGFPGEVGLIRTFLEEQGKHFASMSRVNRDINNDIARRLAAAEKQLRDNGIDVPAA